ncbi:putative translation initiation factor [Leptomonas pyrrhocoris]|uniref:Putative translation initiation factor n=1 Tax=Leptomonas pyrrhocoris TaxID=157538 RepID=A0A0M9FUD2_LEPPY|nr:putative translation initiation factor [Leptomonas pyrrhocoris]XP_015654714.1 putative translation initiation factor [Leptomonas pyrrhocoris]XP_015654715.1 putative translation initiation factor [Leptomonas pyrrhocoris]KPA76274.1 putative translation initiation factor [Leptomonas pyrrhocoris]KPA76275.1 putative translation initiation factor [Leptomonas pyrrhocoris]KPA76276.1 putative translation initiation factor [Leptomonas pyrrhocoris]|eukprot:XP_015654713.1 putative translation initiation factor [Leptomonas pyrrhocoris]
MTEVNFGRHILIDGLPNNVTPDKRELFKRHFSRRITEVLGHDQINLQLLQDRETALVKGAILSCVTEEQAEAALAKLNRFPFTKTSILTTYRWSSLEEARQDLGPYVPPTLPDGDEEEEAELVHNMAEDPEARPQFLVKGGASFDCEWYWFNWEKNEPELYRRRKLGSEDPLNRWSEVDRTNKKLSSGMICGPLPVSRPLPVWSTYGSMVISQHEKGLRVWAGRSMRLHFEITLDVNAFMVSPCEKYIIVQTPKDISIINLRTAKKIRTIGNLDLHSDDLWPVMRFSADDSLVVVCKTTVRAPDSATVPEGQLNIYPSETMKLLKGDGSAGHTFSVRGLYKAEWNPVVDTQMGYVCELGPNQGWKAVVADMVVNEDGEVEQRVLNERNFLLASRLDMLWHPAGTFLCVKVSSMKGPTEYFLFHIAERNVPITRLSIKRGYIPTRFAWQTGGDKFAVLLKKDGVGSGLGETGFLQIFMIGKQGPKVQHEVPTSATHLFWAPHGGRLAAANFDKSLLHFFVLHDNNTITDKNKLSGVNATNCEWDPTGRYFAVWVSSIHEQAMSAQYRIFDYTGNELYRKAVKTFSHFAWRPLPPTLVDSAQMKKVRESMKMLLHDYEATAAALKAASEEQVEKERKLKEDEYVKKMKQLAEQATRDKLTEIREEEYANSKWVRYNNSRIKALPEEERTVHEDVTESHVVSRRLVTSSKK